MVFLFAYNSGACTVKLSLVSKKRKSPRTFLYIFYLDQLLSILLGLILKNVPNNICILSNLKYVIICK